MNVNTSRLSESNFEVHNWQELRCIHCQQSVAQISEHLECPGCGAGYPIIDGIPRFFEENDYYWGESGSNAVAPATANEFVQQARVLGWRTAVQQRFGSSPLAKAILDPQRAAWTALLGLEASAIALDVGCGWGAITHALAQRMGTVYSVDAVRQRLEFTQERLRQEKITNVRLMQASAITLPFAEGSFDLIVCNGILEWIGDWDRLGTPRVAQLRFLRQLQRLLKNDGVLVVGIENRFGYDAFQGTTDHSGLRYTSLLPRWLANRYIRYRHKGDGASDNVRSANAACASEYRTYTYSVSGYKRLFDEAGFRATHPFWTHPSYNEPYELVPLGDSELVEHFMFGGSFGRRKRSLLRDSVKSLLKRLHLLRWFVPNFVLIVTKEKSRASPLANWLASELSQVTKTSIAPQNIVCFAETAAFDNKHILQFSEPVEARGTAFVKAELFTPASIALNDGEVQEEYRLLRAACTRLEQATGGRVAAPRPLGTAVIGNYWYSMESGAQGIPLIKIVSQPGYFADEQTVRDDLGIAIRALTDMSLTLKGILDFPEIPSGLYKPKPVGLNSNLWNSLSEDAAAAAGWVQHGDMWVNHLFMERKTKRVEIIDWAHARRGYPALYDCFSLLISCNYFDARRRHIPSSYSELCRASVQDLFFTKATVPAIVCELLEESCSRMEVRAETMPRLFLAFLVVQVNFHRSRGRLGQTRAQVFEKLIAWIDEQQSLTFLGKYPLNNPFEAQG